jgi:hypothetical protein
MEFEHQKAVSDAYRANWDALWGERAAIMQYDGNLSRSEAERLATHDMMHTFPNSCPILDEK